MRPTAGVSGATSATKPVIWPSIQFALLLLVGLQPVLGLENGLARTPPMGWLAWERFLCNIDCVDDPENCVSERLFKEMGDAFVMHGYREVGYKYVNIDDCWMAKRRDASGRLQANRTRFPNGIKHLANFLHSRGLKLGIYGDVGTKTCEEYPGSKKHLLLDAQTFAEWDVDMVKMDGCFANITEYRKLYPDFGDAINKTGRPMVYSCSWPAYQVFSNVTPNYTLIGHHCNMWRNYVDIADSWRSVEKIIDYYAKNQEALVAAAAPGRWNDPDMLVIGNFGLSYDQSKAQMALWAIMAAPLLMSHDLRHTRHEFREILQNRAIIAVNQDPLGIMGKRIKKIKKVETWVRPVTPVVGTAYSYALVFFNRNDMGNTRKHVSQLRTIGLTHPCGYHVTDLFENRYLGLYYPDSFLKVRVNPSGGVVMVKAEAVRRAPFACLRPRPKYPPKQPQYVSGTVKGVGTPVNGTVLVGLQPVEPQVSPVPEILPAMVAIQGRPNNAVPIGNEE
ncbi:hypothetical protein MRX96_037628 [Rhipicephalus microplus]